MKNHFLLILILVLSTDTVLLSQYYKIVGTGQTISYDSTRAITIPTSGQAFFGQNSNHPGNKPSYTNNGNGTVTDNVTGLMWQQTVDRNGDGKIDFYDKLTYYEALDSAAKCKTGGYNDWRLPTIKELYSLAGFYCAEPGPNQLVPVKFIDTTYTILFSRVVIWSDKDVLPTAISRTDILVCLSSVWYYFSVGVGDVNSLSHGSLGTERVIDGQIASSKKYVSKAMGVIVAMFGFNFIDGRINGYPTTSTVSEDGTAKHFYILFVRGNTDYETKKFVDNGNGTIFDNATGLIWMQNNNGTAVLWKESVNYAENFSFAGYSDWLLPDTKELQSIVDYSRSPSTTNSAAINPIFNCTQITNEGGAADYPWYWSNTTFSTQSPSNGASASYVCFGRAMGYFSGIGWTDIHGAGCQRSDPKPSSLIGYTKNGNGYYNANAPQGDAVRIFNNVRLVRDAKGATGINDNDLIPTNYGLEQNYPNPNSNTTNIQYSVSDPWNVSIKLFDTFGNEVSTLLNQYQQIGIYIVS